MPEAHSEIRRPDKLASLLVFALFTTVIFLPRPPIGGSQFLLYPFIGSLAGIAILAFGIRGLHTKSRHFCLLLAASILLYSAAHLFSLILNNIDIRQLAIIEVFRPIMLLLLFFAGLSLGKFGNRNHTHALGLAARFTLIGQLIICLTQGLNLHIFDLVYSTEKTFGFGSILRLTGSMNNPNTLGWIVTQATVICIVTAENRKVSLPWVFLGTLLVLGTGSRSQFLLYVPSLVFAIWAVRGMKITLVGLSTITAAIAGFFSILLAVLFIFKDRFRYLWEVIKIFQTGSLSSIPTFQKRLDMWDTRWSVFERHAESINWIFGLGPMPVFRVTDNDYLYVIVKYGLLGLSFQLLLCGLLLYGFLKYGSKELRAIGVTYVIFALVVGFQVETFGGWLYPLFPFFYCGLCLAKALPASSESAKV